MLVVSPKLRRKYILCFVIIVISIISSFFFFISFLVVGRLVKCTSVSAVFRYYYNGYEITARHIIYVCGYYKKEERKKAFNL